MAGQHNRRTALRRAGNRSLQQNGQTSNGRHHDSLKTESPSNGEMTALLGSIRRRWLAITTLGIVISAAAVALVWFFVEPPFRATAELRIREIPDRLLFKTEEPGGFETYKQTQMRLVKSSFVLTNALGHPQVAPLSMVQEQEHPVDWLQKELKVDSPATEFIRISLEGDRPEELAEIVNAVTEAYQQEVVKNEHDREDGRLARLREVERRLDADLETERKNLQALARSLSSADSETISIQQQLAMEYFGQLRREHARIRFELMRIEAQLAARSQDGEPSPEDVKLDPALVQAELEELSEIRSHKKRQRQMETVIREMKRRFNSVRHPAILEAESSLADMEKELGEMRKELLPGVEETLRRQILSNRGEGLAQLTRQQEVLKAQFQQIEKELQSQETENKQNGLMAFDLEVQKKRVEEAEQMAEQIKERIQQIEVELEAQPRVAIFHKADVPHTPMIARKFKMMGFAGLGSFALIAGLILWIDLSSKRISSITEVVNGLKLPILGALPIMPRGLIEGNKAKRGARPLALLGAWKESIDSTRALLLSQTRSRGRREHQTIMVTSALSGEGKTTLAGHLAISLAQSGRKTLLIDADLRRPAIHQVFGMSGEFGLSDVLRGEAAWEDVVQSAGIAGLSVLPAGQVDPFSLQRLAADAAGPLLEEFRQHYDFVIVDSAPILPVTDALMIGPHVDGALFAVRRDVSRRGKVSSACERLERVGVPLLGAVVIGLDSQEPTDRYTPFVPQPIEVEVPAHRSAAAVN